MGSHVLAPEKVRSERTTRGFLAMFLVMGVLAAITITGSGIAGATNLSGTFAPKVYGGKVDLNGDGPLGDFADDDAEWFMDNTDLINGTLDCDDWTTTVNDVTDEGDSTAAQTDDDCELRAYDGTSDGIWIYVEDGLFSTFKDTETGTEFEISDGWQLPAIYRTTLLTSTTVSSADWAWTASGGKIDINHSGSISAADCKDDLVSGFDVLGADCGDAAGENGYIDMNGDSAIDKSDTCYTGCFYGYNVVSGLLQSERPGDATTGATGATGAAGKDGVSGRTTINASSSKNSLNKSKSATCSSTTKVLGGGYSLVGDTATLAHLTVVANGPVSGGWRVRVIEATPTSGSWQIDVTAVCAIA